MNSSLFCVELLEVIVCYQHIFLSCLVEIMTYVSWKLSAFPKSRVIGIGCNLDTERFQYVIANLLKAQTLGKEAWIIGEQGEGKGKRIGFDDLDWGYPADGLWATLHLQFLFLLF